MHFSVRVSVDLRIRWPPDYMIFRPASPARALSGKASSVEFAHFAFTAAQLERFRAPGTQVTLGFSHPRYGHTAVLPLEVRAELANDFD
jgi:hypothetical protein